MVHHDMSFEATIDSASILKPVFSLIQNIVEETIISVEKDGIETLAMDTAHVVMILVNLPPDMFSKYECFEKWNANVKVIDVVKIFARATIEDIVKLNRKGTSLGIMFEREKVKRRFTLKTQELPGNNLNAFEEERDQLKSLRGSLEEKFLLRFTIGADILEEIVKDAEIISDLITIKGDKQGNTLNITASDDAGDVESELDLSTDANAIAKLIMFKDENLDGEKVTSASAIYALQFLREIVKFKDITKTFTISMGQDIPIMIEMDVGNYCQYCGTLFAETKLQAHEKKCKENPDNKEDGTESKILKENPKRGKLILMLAPRVEDQNEESEDGVDQTSEEDEDLEMAGDEEGE